MADEIEKAKFVPTATVTPLPRDEPSPTEESAAAKPDRNVAAGVWAIVCGVALPCIPVIVVSAILLYFIFRYEVVPRAGWPDLQLPVNHTKTSRTAIQHLYDARHHGGSAAYYVHYNPSTITTIASWTGRVIPYLSSSIMALVAFFTARRIVTKSNRAADGVDLPCPEQLTLLINLLGGNSFGPLRDTMVYRWAKKERLIDPLPTAFFALLAVTGIGLLIPIVDTWFGIATTPFVLTQLYNTTASGYHSFGRRLSQTQCPNGPGSFAALGGLDWMPCNIDYNDQQLVDPFLVNPEEATRVTQGISTENVLSNYSSASGTMYYYLADTHLDAKLDFKADTFAVSTQCKPITKQCLPDQTTSELNGFFGDGVTYNFTCSPGWGSINFTFPGQVQTADMPIDGTFGGAGRDASGFAPIVGIGFSPDVDLSSRVGVYDPNLLNESVSVLVDGVIPPDSPALGTNLSYKYVLPKNPLNYAVWATGYPSFNYQLQSEGSIGNSSFYTNPLLADPNIYYSSLGFTYWVLQCSTVVYNVTYTWVNGTINTFNATPSEAGFGGLLSAPFAFQVGSAANTLSSIAGLAGSQNTSADLAKEFAGGFSKASLAMSIGAIEPGMNTIEQVRNSTVSVARVPMVPLYLLLGLKALYVIAVIFLAIGAYCFTHPAETEVVKAQLSTKGLAAAHFETPGLLQANVVQEVQSRLGKGNGNAPQQERSEEDPRQGLQRAQSLEAPKKVGLVAHADGTWKFAVIANGVWQSIKPIAVSFVDMEAKDGKMGGVGDVYNAWHK